MKLEDLIPETPTFSLATTKKTYELRLPNLEDRVMMGRLGDLGKIFSERRWDDICKIVYPLLKDKSDFLAEKQTIIDDEGFEKQVMVIGPIRLLRAIQTQDEAIQMLTAFNAAVTASEPLIREFVENELKKNNGLNRENNGLNKNRTGEKYSTQLHPSMDIPLSSLEDSRLENLTPC